MNNRTNRSPDPTTPSGPASRSALGDARAAAEGQAIEGGVAQAGHGKTNPDEPGLAGGQVLPTMGDNPPVPGQGRGAGAKMVGGGLEAGTTDFGSSTAATQGGRGGAGTSSSRTAGNGIRGPAATDAPGNISGFGGGHLVTGRPTQVDDRSAIGAAAVSGGPSGAVQDAGSGQNPGGPTRTGAGTTSVGTAGGGLAGKPASGRTDRAVDMVEGRTAGPEGDVAGTGNMYPGAEPGRPNLGGFGSANEGTMEHAQGEQSWAQRSKEDTDRGNVPASPG